MINIENVDFIIPFRGLYKDQNIAVDMVARYLAYYFETNYYEIEDIIPKGICNKAALLNRGFKSSEEGTNSPILCLHDADVFLRPFQHLTAIKLLQEDKFDLVVPHNGYIYNLLKEYQSLLYNNSEFIFEINKQMVLRDSPRNFSGVLYIKRDFFRKIGMANENLGFTYKVNAELLERATKLKARIGTVAGPILHLFHSEVRLKGINDKEAYCLTIQNYKERVKINSMTQKELKNYIKTWSWIKEE